MQTAPKSLRLQIGLVGRTNVGKSSFLNYIAGQDVAVTSPVPGTTTDVVEKAMELLPIGPVTFLDTAGLDDRSDLGERRLRKTAAALERADILVLLTEPNQWSEFEQRVVDDAAPRKQPVIVVVNKTDLPSLGKPDAAFPQGLEKCTGWLECSCLDAAQRERVVCRFKELLLKACPDDYVNPPALVADLLPPGGLMVMVVPIDLQAPKGRLILPQVQAIRDALDGDAAALVVKEREYAALLGRLNRPPDLVVCDSQVVLKMVADTPASVKCTTFSILFARYKGDLQALARGAAMIDRLRAGDRVLVAESCSHHALEDDIGRVKIPRWLRQYTGLDVQIDVSAGRDFPQDLTGYKLVVHCGSCMLTRREMLAHIQRAQAQGVAITNYGLAISVTQGVLKRALSPFPAALDAFEREISGRMN
jgi:[FeFe] hydrogenase H-cluster maturation GTPase HydF